MQHSPSSGQGKKWQFDVAIQCACLHVIDVCMGPKHKFHKPILVLLSPLERCWDVKGEGKRAKMSSGLWFKQLNWMVGSFNEMETMGEEFGGLR